MALTEVTHVLLDAEKTPRTGVEVTAELVAPYGYLTGTNQEVIDPVTEVTDSTGLVSLTLIPTSEFVYLSAVYKVTWEGAVRWITVPPVGPVNLIDVLTQAPAVGPATVPVVARSITEGSYINAAGRLILTFSSAPLTQDVGVVNPGPAGPAGGSLNPVSTSGAGSAALTAADALVGQAHLPAGLVARTVLTSVTLTKPLSVPPGASVQPASGVVLTLAGVTAGRYKIFDLTAGGTVAFAEGTAEVVFPEWWGAKFDNVTLGTPNGDAIRAASAACLAAGGGVVSFPAGTAKISGKITFGHKVSPRGPGKAVCTLRCTDAAAQVECYDANTDQRRSSTGGFTVDGNHISLLPMVTRMGADMEYRDIKVLNGQTNWLRSGIQNSTYINCDSLNTGIFTQFCLVDDLGVQNTSWYGGTIKDATVACVYVTQSGPSNAPTTLQCENNHFYGTVIERSDGNSILFDAGTLYGFHNLPTSGTSANPRVVLRRRLKPDGLSTYRTSLWFDNCNINGAAYAVDARAATSTGAPATYLAGVPAPTWSAALTPIGSFPVAELRMSGPTPISASTACVQVDDGVEVKVGDLLTRSNPTIVPMFAKTGTKPLPQVARYSGALVVPFAFPGTLTVTTDAAGLPFYLDGDYELLWVRMGLRDSPLGTGSQVRVDINKNNTTVYPVQTNRPTILAGGTNKTSITVPPAPIIFVYGDYLTVNVDEVGSSTAGANLLVEAVLRPV